MRNFLLFFCTTLAAIVISKAYDCEFDNELLEVGENYSQPGECRLIMCTKPHEYRILNCFEEPLTDCIYYPRNNSLPYPDCCSRNECPNLTLTNLPINNTQYDFV